MMNRIKKLKRSLITLCNQKCMMYDVHMDCTEPSFRIKGDNVDKKHQTQLPTSKYEMKKIDDQIKPTEIPHFLWTNLSIL